MESQVAAPIKDIPECWRDEKRMNVLFAPFKERDINPVDWDSKMKFWRTVIEKWCLEKNQSFFSIKTLQHEFKRKGKIPQSIPTVVDDLLRSGDLKKKADFMSIDPNKSWSGWAVDSFIKAPLWWSVSKISEALVSPDNCEAEYVHIPFLKERGEQLISIAESNEEEVITCKEAKEMLSSVGAVVSDDCLLTILQWLQIERKAYVQSVNGKQIIKLLHKHSKNRNSISEADMAIFKLREHIQIISKNLEHLELAREKCLTDAKAYLSKGLRQSAKSCLKKKKELEKCMEKRAVTLANMETLLVNLQNTDNDSQVIDAYRVGLSALKSTFKSAGLTEDEVFDTMNELQEMNDIQDEIQMAISQPVAKLEDEADLEEELADILAMDAEKDLPSVPVHEPSSGLDEFGLPDLPTHEVKLPTTVPQQTRPSF